jgi:hypothetical protein
MKDSNCLRPLIKHFRESIRVIDRAIFREPRPALFLGKVLTAPLTPSTSLSPIARLLTSTHFIKVSCFVFLPNRRNSIEGREEGNPSCMSNEQPVRVFGAFLQLPLRERNISLLFYCHPFEFKALSRFFVCNFLNSETRCWVKSIFSEPASCTVAFER